MEQVVAKHISLSRKPSFLRMGGAEVVNTLFGIRISVPKTLLPIGISFFTFQAMSYVIDVYRQKAEVQSNLFYVGLYISFFPQLIAGPIVRYETIADQIKNRQESLNGLFDGFARFVEGLSKKVLLVNAFAVLADQAFNADISKALPPSLKHISLKSIHPGTT